MKSNQLMKQGTIAACILLLLAAIFIVLYFRARFEGDKTCKRQYGYMALSTIIVSVITQVGAIILADKIEIQTNKTNIIITSIKQVTPDETNSTIVTGKFEENSNSLWVKNTDYYITTNLPNSKLSVNRSLYNKAQIDDQLWTKPNIRLVKDTTLYQLTYHQEKSTNSTKDTIVLNVKNKDAFLKAAPLNKPIQEVVFKKTIRQLRLNP